jgi:hypothetical protein
MTDEAVMRLRLQTVAAYRELCRTVQRSGRENVVFAFLMMGFAYFLHSRGMAPPLILILYGILIGGELLIGLFKWAVPSAEGILFDGVVLLVFAAFNFGIAYLRFQNGNAVSPVIVFLGLFMLFGAFGRFRAYMNLRQLFAERPSAEHLAWFDELVREIQTADPQTDELVLDLPTRPHWKAKLLGGTAFFVATGGNAAWVAGPDDFSLVREKTDHGTGRRKALLRIHGEAYPEFDLADASWGNYLRWRAALAPAPAAT